MLQQWLYRNALPPYPYLQLVRVKIAEEMGARRDQFAIAPLAPVEIEDGFELDKEEEALVEF